MRATTTIRRVPLCSLPPRCPQSYPPRPPLHCPHQAETENVIIILKIKYTTTKTHHFIQRNAETLSHHGLDASGKLGRVLEHVARTQCGSAEHHQCHVLGSRICRVIFNPSQQLLDQRVTRIHFQNLNSIVCLLVQFSHRLEINRVYLLLVEIIASLGII